MKFVFFDVETTGTSVPFDQILQFGAALTDDKFRILDRFVARCRRLPWVVPSPGAILVTDVSLKNIDDPTLPSFEKFIASVRERLLSWSPAVFIGYNSFRFDEPLFQRALWQTLFPPYLTVTRGNSRFDVLLFARAIEALKPDALFWPRDSGGNVTFRLDRLAPQMGFNYTNAHDAEADVDATIYVAKRLAESFPKLWTALLSRTKKVAFDSTFPLHEVVVIPERSEGTTRIWRGQRIDRQNRRHAIFADLTADWTLLSEDRSREGGQKRLLQYIRKVTFNRAVPVFTKAEVSEFVTLPSPPEIQMNSDFLRLWPGAAALATLAPETQYVASEQQGELEQMIHDGFATSADERRMAEFHIARLSDRHEIAESFEDKRFRALAMRMIYVSEPSLLTPREIERVRGGIQNRLYSQREPDSYAWRSVAKARTELQELRMDPRYPPAKLDEIEDWLNALVG